MLRKGRKSKSIGPIQERNDHHISYSWKITDPVIIKQIHSATSNKAFRSDNFEIGGLRYFIKLYPNGNAEVKNNGKYMLFVQLLAMPNSWKTIHFSWTLCCEQTGACDHRIDTLESAGGKGRPLGAFAELKQFHQLTFRVTVNVLRVYLKDNNKLNYQFTPKQFESVRRLTWTITGDLLTAVKSSYVAKRFTSDLFGDMWRIQIAPNGLSDNSKGEFLVNLLLCAYPVNVNILHVSRTDRCLQTNVTRQGQLSYEWGKRPPVLNAILASFVDIKKYDSLEISIEVTIQKTFTIDGEEIDMVLRQFEEYAKKANYVQGSQQKVQQTAPDKNPNRKMTQTMSDKFSVHDVRLDSMAAAIEQLNGKIQKMENQMSRLLSQQEEKKENDNEDIMKEITNLKREVSKLTAEQPNNQLTDTAKDRLRVWLTNVVGLPYFDLFIENGIEDLDTIKEFTQNELQMIGIDKIGHRIKIMKCIRTLETQQVYQSLSDPQSNQYEGGKTMFI
eukprot:1047480_1